MFMLRGGAVPDDRRRQELGELRRRSTSGATFAARSRGPARPVLGRRPGATAAYTVVWKSTRGSSRRDGDLAVSPARRLVRVRFTRTRGASWSTQLRRRGGRRQVSGVGARGGLSNYGITRQLFSGTKQASRSVASFALTSFTAREKPMASSNQTMATSSSSSSSACRSAMMCNTCSWCAASCHHDRPSLRAFRGRCEWAGTRVALGASPRAFRRDLRLHACTATLAPSSRRQRGASSLGGRERSSVNPGSLARPR